MSSPASSSSTARDDLASASPRSHTTGLTGSTSNKKRPHNESATSTHRSTASRMPRTLQTIPVWARKDAPSPPSTPPRAHSPEQGKPSMSNTWPRAPVPAFLQAPAQSAMRDIEESRPPRDSSSSYEEASGPGRFWSFTLPSRMRGDGDSRDGGAANVQGQRRPSMIDTISATVGDTFASLASTAYMGSAFRGRETTTASAANEDEEGEKQVEQGDVDPLGGWSNDSDQRSPRLPQEEQQKQQQQKEKSDRLRTLHVDESFSRHQPLTPGWESPWRPESREGHSIEFGRYRFNNHGEGGYFPHTNTIGSNNSRKRRRVGKNGMTSTHARERSGASLVKLDWWKNFLIMNAFVPLLIRLINIIFTTTTLAVAIRLHLILQSQQATDSVGSSPIVAIIFSPLTLVHVGAQIWLEYFSRPIGLWRVSNKLFYTMIELIYICLWSGELAIAFDNYFTSTLVCTTLNSPYADNSTFTGQQTLIDPSKKPSICNLQIALIGLVFVSLIAYVVALTLSLFRIFVRIARR